MKQHQENVSEELLAAKGGYRDRADLLRSRLCMLSGQDRLLMTMYWENGISIRQISRLTGISRSTIDRRLNKLTRRLMKGEYIIYLRNSKKFNKKEMAIAKDYILLGKSMKKIAEKRETSYYHVRNILGNIKHFLETAITNYDKEN